MKYFKHPPLERFEAELKIWADGVPQIREAFLSRALPEMKFLHTWLSYEPELMLVGDVVKICARLHLKLSKLLLKIEVKPAYVPTDKDLEEIYKGITELYEIRGYKGDSALARLGINSLFESQIYGPEINCLVVDLKAKDSDTTKAKNEKRQPFKRFVSLLFDATGQYIQSRYNDPFIAGPGAPRKPVQSALLESWAQAYEISAGRKAHRGNTNLLTLIPGVLFKLYAPDEADENNCPISYSHHLSKHEVRNHASILLEELRNLIAFDNRAVKNRLGPLSNDFVLGFLRLGLKRQRAIKVRQSPEMCISETYPLSLEYYRNTQAVSKRIWRRDQKFLKQSRSMASS